MRVLIDESLPRALAGALTENEARTVQQMGWSGIGNGELLRRAAAEGFGALVTADRNLKHQQNLANAGVAVIVVRAPSNRVKHILPLAPRIEQALRDCRPGQLIHVGTQRRQRGRRRR